MTLWDGLTSANKSGMPAQIVVLGATNRVNDIDEAILRRMPKKFAVPLPRLAERRNILQLVLRDTKTEREHFDLDYLAKVTAGMSGSDIKEACRDAAMAPVREYMRQHRQEGRPMATPDSRSFRGIRTDDFFGTQGGGGQVITDNHRRQSKKAAPTNKNKGSSDEYEDTDEP